MYGHTKGSLNSNLHTACDEQGHSIFLLLSKRQMSDYTSARHMLCSLPTATYLRKV